MSAYIEDLNIKLLLSDIRIGDYTHPGEEEAIELVSAQLNTTGNPVILDVACGLGGTANKLSKLTNASTTGIDFDNECIAYAKNKYKNINFYHEDAHKLSHILPENEFDIITIFSAFFTFENQNLACKELAKVAKDGAQLAIFDYSSNIKNHKNPLDEERIKYFNPLNLQTIEDIITPWKLTEFIDLTNYFIEQYKVIVKNIEDKRDYLIDKFSASAYTNILNSFNSLLNSFDAGSAGGAMAFATLQK